MRGAGNQVYGYAEQAVEAEYQRDKLKLQLELLYATIDSEVRITAFNEGRKVTEKQVENTVIMNRIYQDKQAQYLQSIRDASMLSSARHAFNGIMNRVVPTVFLILIRQKRDYGPAEF